MLTQTLSNSPLNIQAASMSITAIDRALFERLRAGDMTACDECVELHADNLYGLALRILGDEDAAADVVQDTFLNAFKAIKSFEGRATLGTWLYRIAYNGALMQLRSQKPDIPFAEDDDDEYTPGPVVAWEETPERLLEQHETADILEHAIAGLSPALREVFMLRDVEERTTADTAALLELSESAVKVRLHRARLQLRDRLSSYFGERAHPKIRTMTCEQIMEYLSAYIDNELDEPLKRTASDHIATCEHCHVVVDTTRDTITLYRSQGQRTIPRVRRERLFRDLSQAFSRRSG